jgi:hypothetical protein
LPCRKKKTWWKLASRCCWNRALRLTYVLLASAIGKDLQFGTWTDPSFQRHYRFISTPSYLQICLLSQRNNLRLITKEICYIPLSKIVFVHSCNGKIPKIHFEEQLHSAWMLK